MERAILTAEPGMVLTNGTVYGDMVFLAEGADPAEFYQITKEEHNEIMENPTTAADYEAALARLGVR